jgi:carboxyl-terminal processing protease
MPNTGIGFSFPAEKIFHVNGTPREFFRPAIEVDQLKKSGNKDYILQEALNYLKKKI